MSSDSRLRSALERAETVLNDSLEDLANWLEETEENAGRTPYVAGIIVGAMGVPIGAIASSTSGLVTMVLGSILAIWSAYELVTTPVELPDVEQADGSQEVEDV